jgi:arsenate reductase (thioredoxin)
MGIMIKDGTDLCACGIIDLIRLSKRAAASKTRKSIIERYGKIMKKVKVLFVCIHNSARSQMAEAFLNSLGNQFFEAESAGIEPGNLNPFVVNVMKESGIDISNYKTKSVTDMIKAGKTYDYVVTVCDPKAAEMCPIFPGKTERLHWEFSDPSSFQGSDDEKLAFTRSVRNAIKTAVEDFIKTIITKNNSLEK